MIHTLRKEIIKKNLDQQKLINIFKIKFLKSNKMILNYFNKSKTMIVMILVIYIIQLVFKQMKKKLKKMQKILQLKAKNKKLMKIN